MAEVALAFLWHQHQPYYPDDVAGENPMPWVRLHGVKDYYGMALHLLEFPELACTINLVPSLLVQLQAYTEHQASDRFLDVNRAICEIVGRSRADLLGEPYVRVVHPEDWSTEKDRRAEVLSGQASTYTVDERYVRADGAIRWVTVRASLVGRERPRLLALKDPKACSGIDLKVSAGMPKLSARTSGGVCASQSVTSSVLNSDASPSSNTMRNSQPCGPIPCSECGWPAGKNQRSPSLTSCT